MTPLTQRSRDAATAQTYLGQPLPGNASIFSSLDHFARSHPREPFLTVTGPAGQATICYRELDELTRRVGHWARSRHGLAAGNVVALRVRNDLWSALSLLGLLRAGVTVLVLDPEAPRERASAQREQVKADLAFHSYGQDQPSDGSVPVPRPGTLAESPVCQPRPSGAAAALIFGTSGSTAAAKLVVQSHANLAVNADAMRRHHRLSPGRRFLGCLPIHHVNGLHFTLLANLVSGSHAIMTDGFDPFRYPGLIEDYRPAIASVVPSILESMRYVWRHAAPQAEFRYFVSAAAPLNASTERAVHATCGRRVLQGYGLTETTNFSATMPPDLAPETYATLAAEASIPSVGVALPGNEIAILAADGQPVAAGEIGEVCMRGHNVMSGYAGNEQASARAFRGGWFHSEDLGYCHAEPAGRAFVVLTGRIKNIAKIGGASVSLEEMERVLRAHPMIEDAACAVAPHPLAGERIVAAIVLSAPLTDEEISSHLRRSFPPSALPHRHVRLSSIPRTATGKILRTELGGQLCSLPE